MNRPRRTRMFIGLATATALLITAIATDAVPKQLPNLWELFAAPQRIDSRVPPVGEFSERLVPLALQPDSAQFVGAAQPHYAVPTQMDDAGGDEADGPDGPWQGKLPPLKGVSESDFPNPELPSTAVKVDYAAVLVGPSDGATNIGTTPTLEAKASAPRDGEKFDFTVCPGYTNQGWPGKCSTASGASVSPIAVSGWVDGPTWVVPAGALAPDVTYTWSARVGRSITFEGKPLDLATLFNPVNAFTTGGSLDGPGVNDYRVVLDGPADGSLINSLEPTLQLHLTNAAPQTYQYKFTLSACASIPCLDKRLVADSGWQGSSSWAPPRDVLRWNTIYEWTAVARNGLYTQTFNNPTATFAAGIPVPSGVPSGGTGQAPPVAGVSLDTLQYGVQDADAEVRSAWGPLRLSRSYSSSNTAESAFGVGWNSVLDMRTESTGLGASVRLSNGGSVTFALDGDGTSFAPAPGAAGMALAGSRDSGNLVFTDQDRTQYTFVSNQLTQIQTTVGQTTQLRRTDGNVTSLTDATSKRSLTVDWTDHYISSIQATIPTSGSDAASASAATGPRWEYRYADGRLVAACRVLSAEAQQCKTFQYSDGRLTGLISPNGQLTTRITYDDGDHNVASISNGDGRRQFEGSKNTFGKREVKVTNDAGAVDAYLFNDFNQVVRHTLPSGAKEQWAYTLSGAVSKYSDAASNVLSLNYDEQGHLTGKALDYNGVSISAEYYGYVSAPDASNGALAWVTMNNRHFRGKLALDSFPKPTYVQTGYSYDSSGRLIQIASGVQSTNASDPDTRAYTKHSYTSGTESAVDGGGLQPAGLLATTTDPVGNFTTYSYDVAGNLRNVTKPNGTKDAYGYDQFGNITRRVTQRADGTTAQSVRYSYVADGRLSVRSADSITDSVSGRTRTPETSWTYDNDGNVLSETHSNASNPSAKLTTTFEYDAHDRLVKTTGPDGSVQQERAFTASGLLEYTVDAIGARVRYEYTPERLLNKTILTNYRDPVVSGDTSERTLQILEYDDAGRKLVETDARGQRIKTTYGAASRVQTVTALAGTNPGDLPQNRMLAHYVYGSDGSIVQSSFNNGVITNTYSYDNRQQLIQSREQSSIGKRPIVTIQTDLSRNLDGSVATIRQGNGADVQRESAFTYDSSGNVASSVVQLPGSPESAATTSFTRDPLGHVTALSKEFNGHRQEQAFSYDTAGATTAVGTHIEGDDYATTTFGFDDFGRQTDTIAPDGARTTVERDAMGRITRTVRPGDGFEPRVESTEYQPSGLVSRTVDALGTATSFEYDTLGRPVSVTRPPVEAGGSERVTTLSYNLAGDVLRQQDPNGRAKAMQFNGLGELLSFVDSAQNAGVTEQRRTTFAYSDGGKTVASTDPRGFTSTISKDAFDRLIGTTNPLGQTTSFEYDALGQLTLMKTPEQNTLRMGYDALGNRTSTQSLGADGTQVSSSAASFDAAGNKRSSTDGIGNTTSAVFSGLNRVTQVTYPDGAIQSFSYDRAGRRTAATDPNGNVTTMTYSAAGDLASVVEPETEQYPSLDDRTTRFSYDSAGRLVQRDDPGDATTTNSYDIDGNLVNQEATRGGVPANRAFDYDSFGELVGMRSEAGEQRFAYNGFGELVSSSGFEGNHTFSYDAAGELTEQRSGEETSRFGYDDAGRVSTVDSSDSAHPMRFEHDGDGRVTAQTWGPVRRDFSYNATGQVTADRSSVNGTSSYAMEISYDAAGNVQSRKVATESAEASGETRYSYDGRGRLSNWTSPDGQNHQLGWDAAGNLTSKAGVEQAFDQRNRLLRSGARAFTYSADGFRTSESTGTEVQASEWTPFGELRREGAEEFRYDAFGRLAQDGRGAFEYATTHDTPSRVAGQSVLSVPGLGVAAVGGKLAVSNSHLDVLATFDEAGAVATRTTDPLGSVTNASSNWDSRLGFQGATDSQAGSYRFGERWFGPSTGTFVSADRTVELPDSQLNRFQYAVSNPIGYTDTTGKFAFLAFLPSVATWVGPALAGLAGAAVASLAAWVSSLLTDYLWSGAWLSSALQGLSRPHPSRPGEPIPYRPDGGGGPGASEWAPEVRTPNFQTNPEAFETPAESVPGVVGGDSGSASAVGLCASGAATVACITAIGSVPQACAQPGALAASACAVSPPSVMHRDLTPEDDARTPAAGAAGAAAGAAAASPGCNPADDDCLKLHESRTPKSAKDTALKPEYSQSQVEQKANELLRHVDKKGTPMFDKAKGGARFDNDPTYKGSELLPRTTNSGKSISYREWDIIMNPEKDVLERNAFRLVTGDDGSAYYTLNHYKNFIKLR